MSQKEHREHEIAEALGDEAELIPITEPDEYELAGGEYDGMSLGEYVRLFNNPAGGKQP
jgi:hypothetical protein